MPMTALICRDYLTTDRLSEYRYVCMAGAAVGNPHSHRSVGRSGTQSYVFEVRP